MRVCKTVFFFFRSIIQHSDTLELFCINLLICKLISAIEMCVYIGAYCFPKYLVLVELPRE